MTDSLQAGVLVGHRSKPEWGPGKILARDGAEVLVYFRDFTDPVPEKRIKRFPVAVGLLQVLPEQSDPDLDRLPPYRDGKFVRAKTSLTFEGARTRFLQRCPRGVADPYFWKSERTYKWAAHERYLKHVAPHAAAWVRDSQADALRAALIEVYWPADPSVEPLNLLNPRFEWPAFKDALDADGPLLVYIRAALEFAGQAAPDGACFDRYAKSLAALPARAGGTQLDKWTVLTWLPFIVNPTHHIFLKPEMTQAFASMLPFELQYRAELNPTTYRRLQEMALRLKARMITDDDLNPERRELDMIDVHSFMWLVAGSDSTVC